MFNYEGTEADYLEDGEDYIDRSLCPFDCPFDCETECPQECSKNPILMYRIPEKVVDNAIHRRSKTSITYKVRMLNNSQLINLSKILLRAKDYNKKYEEKARKIVYNPHINLPSNERIVLEALCRGCKNIDVYLKKL